ncbi:hypothetical protein [Kineococcus sp. R86509]|uniref:hypothetical protein n=1 Tax=Kineococcus sp. R86509 TaxID=3093851 RepID=UPI0036D28886
MRRVLSTELRRSGFGFLCVVLLLVGVAVFLGRVPRFSGYNSWSAGWASQAREVNAYCLVLGPVAATVAAWIGAREHRWGMRDLLASAPRSRAHRSLVTLFALILGAVLGFAGTCVLFAVAVAPTATYVSADTGAVVGLSLLGLILCLTVGWAVGRFIPRRLTAPLVGFVLYLGCALLSYSSGAERYFAPVGNLPYSSYQQFLPGVVPAFAGWLVSISAVVLVVVLARRRLWALLPAATAAVSVFALLDLQQDASGYPAWTRRDPVAAQQVCSPGEPVVCVTREHEAFLTETTPLARDMVAEMSAVVDLRGAREDVFGDVAAGYLPIQSLDTAGSVFRGGLADPADVRFQTLMMFVSMRCPIGPSDATETEIGTSFDLSYVAAGLLMPSEREHVDDVVTSPRAEALRQRLRDPEAARAWLARYLQAVHACDFDGLERLAE